MLCGVHSVGEALAASSRAVAVIFVDETHGPGGPVGALVARARAEKISVEAVSVEQLDCLSKGLRHQGVVAISAGDFPYASLEDIVKNARDGGRNGLIVALDEVTDPHNFGAIVRTAVALGADGVITLRDRAAPVTGAVVRASAGATEHAKIARVTNLARSLAALADDGWSVVGLAAEAEENLAEIDLTQDLVLVVGSEGKGLRRLVRERCTSLGKIPLAGPLASLNASVAAAVAMYETLRQRQG